MTTFETGNTPGGNKDLDFFSNSNTPEIISQPKYQNLFLYGENFQAKS